MVTADAALAFTIGEAAFLRQSIPQSLAPAHFAAESNRGRPPGESESQGGLDWDRMAAALDRLLAIISRVRTLPSLQKPYKNVQAARS